MYRMGVPQGCRFTCRATSRSCMGGCCCAPVAGGMNGALCAAGSGLGVQALDGLLLVQLALVRLVRSCVILRQEALLQTTQLQGSRPDTTAGAKPMTWHQQYLHDCCTAPYINATASEDRHVLLLDMRCRARRS